MLSCREVVDRADDVVDGNLKWHERPGFWFHLLICKYCKHYVHSLSRIKSALPFKNQKASDEEVDQITRFVKSHATDHEHQ